MRSGLWLVVACACSSPASSPVVSIEKLDEPAWRRIVVDPYRDLYPEYVRAFEASAPALRAQLAGTGALAIRSHFAGDPALTADQRVIRWALPVLFDSRIATKAEAPIDAVFVDTGKGWRAIVGLDGIVRARIAALDPTCAPLVGLPEPEGCREIGWELANAALRTERESFTRVCALARSICGTRSP
ncbi:MAG TPA: hypothetical protein VIU61_19170 [Kofleriaceae bacterium]